MNPRSKELTEARLGPRGLVRALFRLPDGTFAPKGTGRVLRPGETVALLDSSHKTPYSGVVSRNGKTIRVLEGPTAGSSVKVAPQSPGGIDPNDPQTPGGSLIPLSSDLQPGPSSRPQVSKIDVLSMSIAELYNTPASITDQLNDKDFLLLKDLQVENKARFTEPEDYAPSPETPGYLDDSKTLSRFDDRQAFINKIKADFGTDLPENHPALMAYDNLADSEAWVEEARAKLEVRVSDEKLEISTDRQTFVENIKRQTSWGSGDASPAYHPALQAFDGLQDAENQRDADRIKLQSIESGMDMRADLKDPPQTPGEPTPWGDVSDGETTLEPGEATNALDALPPMRAFSDMGWAVMEQAEGLYLGGADEEDMNPNAVGMIRAWADRYDLDDDTAGDMVERGKQFSDLGWAVNEQMEKVFNGEPLEEQNPNALELISEFVRRQPWFGGADADWDSLADEIDAFLETKKLPPQSPGVDGTDVPSFDWEDVLDVNDPRLTLPGSFDLDQDTGLVPSGLRRLDRLAVGGSFRDPNGNRFTRMGYGSVQGADVVRDDQSGLLFQADIGMLVLPDTARPGAQEFFADTTSPSYHSRGATERRKLPPQTPGGITTPDNLIVPPNGGDWDEGDGNAFAVMGRVRKALKRAGNKQDVLDDYSAQATSGDYNHLLQVSFAFTSDKTPPQSPGLNPPGPDWVAPNPRPGWRDDQGYLIPREQLEKATADARKEKAARSDEWFATLERGDSETNARAALDAAQTKVHHAEYAENQAGFARMKERSDKTPPQTPGGKVPTFEEVAMAMLNGDPAADAMGKALLADVEATQRKRDARKSKRKKPPQTSGGDARGGAGSSKEWMYSVTDPTDPAYVRPAAPLYRTPAEIARNEEEDLMAQQQYIDELKGPTVDPSFRTEVTQTGSDATTDRQWRVDGVLYEIVGAQMIDDVLHYVIINDQNDAVRFMPTQQFIQNGPGGLREASVRTPTALDLQEAVVGRKAVGGARGLIREIMRLDDGTFAPKGTGRFLKPGTEVKVPHKSGKGFVTGKVRGSRVSGSFVELQDGPDAGERIVLTKPDAPFGGNKGVKRSAPFGGKKAPATPGPKSSDNSPNGIAQHILDLDQEGFGVEDRLFALDDAKSLDGIDRLDRDAVARLADSGGFPELAAKLRGKKKAPETPGVPGAGEGFVDNAETSNPISLIDLEPGTLFKLKNGDTYRLHKQTENGGVIGKPVKMADGTTGGKAKFFNGKLAPKQINTEKAAAVSDVPKPAKQPGGLSLSNVGPKGNPRNVKVMSDSKLKALSSHPDVEPFLKARVDTELTKRGADAPAAPQAPDVTPDVAPDATPDTGVAGDSDVPKISGSLPSLGSMFDKKRKTGLGKSNRPIHDGKDFALYSDSDNRAIKKLIDSSASDGPLGIDAYRALLSGIDGQFDGGGDTAVRDKVYDYAVDHGLVTPALINKTSLNVDRDLKDLGRAKGTKAGKKEAFDAVDAPKTVAAEKLSYDSIPGLKKGTKLNLKDTGPSGKVRNVKAMQPAKLKAISENPDAEPALKNRVRTQLKTLGYDVPSDEPAPFGEYFDSDVPDDLPSLAGTGYADFGEPATPAQVSRLKKKAAAAAAEEDAMWDSVLSPLVDILDAATVDGPGGNAASKLRDTYRHALKRAKGLDPGEQMSMGPGQDFRIQNKDGKFHVQKGTDLDAALDPQTDEPMVYNTAAEAAAMATAAERAVDMAATWKLANLDNPSGQDFVPKSPNASSNAPGPQGKDAKRIAAAWARYDGKLAEFKAIPDTDKKERARVAAQVRAAKHRIGKAGGDPANRPDGSKDAPQTPGASKKPFRRSATRTGPAGGEIFGDFQVLDKEAAYALVDALNDLVASTGEGGIDDDQKVYDLLNSVDGAHPGSGVSDTVTRELVFKALTKKGLYDAMGQRASDREVASKRQ